MKIYVKNNGFVMSGKAWEIRTILKDYCKRYRLVHDWLEDTNNRTI